MRVHHERSGGFPDAVRFTEIDGHSRRSLRDARGLYMSPPPRARNEWSSCLPPSMAVEVP
ncbi:hypothetical protein C8Q76DRAFT_732789 [Earliella scabrosa]|nr:hypothetical protein C8Q76DRAFT_732789 [Earliella scabrosa]